jgi:hypothetical protein
MADPFRIGSMVMVMVMVTMKEEMLHRCPFQIAQLQEQTNIFGRNPIRSYDEKDEQGLINNQDRCFRNPKGVF